MSTLGVRNAIWQSLQQSSTRHDLIIIGGGITGAGILREATRHGLKVLLVEQRDFAWGTSSRSSKMVHGGLRYIAQGDFRLTRHSALERERLIREAPGLVERMSYLFPIRHGQIPGKFIFNTLLKLYDGLAGIKTHGWHDKAAVLARAPGLNANGLQGANYYTDAVTDDARLVLRVLQQACAEGGQVLNYVAADSLLRDKRGRVDGVQLRDVLSGVTLNLHANCVINATGAWVDQLRETVAGERTIRPLRGSHIIISASKIPVQDALTLFHPQDKRAVFIFPWEGTTVIGTTDLDHKLPLNTEPGITRTELDYLLQLVQQQFPNAKISADDVISTYAGVRPVISKNRSKDPSKEKRDHQVWVDQGLVSVSGGKLTTFRLIARDTLRAARPLLPGVSLRNPKEQVFELPTVTPAQLSVKDAHWAQRLIGRYGDAVTAVLDAAPPELEKIAGTAFCLAELRWSCRNEQIVHLDDLLLRRTRVGLLLRQGAAELLPPVKDICQQELGWNDDRWHSEEQRYRSLWRQHYFLPGESA
ncbi:MAG TPA: glycerol-3-phosphate dehydrogenase/oxidase [Dongiaceae bacterium]|nr:glycerol-3-phosphate dehydrogenase/oxidase [Dongiaceae bacterium]